MKIGLVRRGHSATGGAEAYLLRFAAEAQALGHEPILITTAEWPEDRWIGGRIVRLPGATPEEFAASFAREQTGCDVHLSLERVPGCEVFRAGDGVHAAWLKRRQQFEPLWKRMTRWVNRKHGQLVKLEREIFDPEKTRAVIANSRMVRDEIIAHFAFPAERIHVVANGLRPVVERADRGEARRKFGIGDEEFCALFVGSGWDRKGLRTVIEAVEMSENVRLLVAGRGPADSFRSDAATFVGPVSELAALFAAADVFVLPTWYDPFSNACLEALAAGLPVITTKANGFSEIIEAGVYGEIVEAGDALAIAEAFDAWRLRGRALAARGACRAKAAEFSIERNARETIAVLESART